MLKTVNSYIENFIPFAVIIGEVITTYIYNDNMYAAVILIDNDKYDSVYNELLKNDRIERIINDRQTLEEYQEIVNSGI